MPGKMLDSIGRLWFVLIVVRIDGSLCWLETASHWNCSRLSVPQTLCGTDGRTTVLIETFYWKSHGALWQAVRRARFSIRNHLDSMKTTWAVGECFSRRYRSIYNPSRSDRTDHDYCADCVFIERCSIRVFNLVPNKTQPIAGPVLPLCPISQQDHQVDLADNTARQTTVVWD